MVGELSLQRKLGVQYVDAFGLDNLDLQLEAILLDLMLTDIRLK
ncbi:MAG: hypothetical protein R2728_11210 [Chitinophagales bacterium]